jgi:hypothetical protein
MFLLTGGIQGTGADCERQWRPGAAPLPARSLANVRASAHLKEVIHQPIKPVLVGTGDREPSLDKVPNTKNEIEMLIVAELRDCQDCETAWGVVVIAVEDDDANWTVSQFNRGESSAFACDQALLRIVPHYQRLYQLVQKH